MMIRPNKPTLWIRSFVFMVAVAATLGFLAHAEDLVLIKGATQQVPVPGGIKRVFPGVPGVIEVRPLDDGSNLVVTAKSEGTAELRVERVQGTDLDYKITVHADIQPVLGEVKELLSNIVGLEIKPLNGKILLRGAVVSKDDFDTVRKVIDFYPGLILDLTKFDLSGMNSYAARAISNDIALDTVTVRVEGDTAILEGEVYGVAEMERALELAKLKMPKVRNLLHVESVMIETDIEFIAVSAGNGSDFGQNLLQNGSSATGGVTGGNTGKPVVNFGVNATGSLNAQLAKNNQHVLVRGGCNALSGSECTYHNGNTVYIPVTGNVGGDIKPVSYGIIISVKPTLEGRNNIRDEVNITISAPSGTTAPLTINQLLDLKDTVVCKIGDSIVLAGLSQAIKSASKNKTPFFGDIPALNLFFSESTKNNNSQDLVVMLTPRPVFSHSPTGAAYNETERKKLLPEAAKAQ